MRAKGLIACAGPAAEPPRTAAAGAPAAQGAPAEAALNQRPSALRTLALPVLQQVPSPKLPCWNTC